MKFYCIADEDTVRGFRLAGVAGEVVAAPDEAAYALDRAAHRRDIGVIIVTHEVAADARDKVDAIRMRRAEPLIVEIPGPEGPMPGRKTLRRFVQEAVGIRIGRKEPGE